MATDIIARGMAGVAAQAAADVSDRVTALGTVLSYKGTVNKVADLPKNAKAGDVYNVAAKNGDFPAGTNYAYNGTDWDALGGEISLADFVTKSDADLSYLLDAITQEQIDTMINGD